MDAKIKPVNTVFVRQVSESSASLLIDPNLYLWKVIKRHDLGLCYHEGIVDELPFNIRAINRGWREYSLGSFDQQAGGLASCFSLKWLDFGKLFSFLGHQYSHRANGGKNICHSYFTEFIKITWENDVWRYFFWKAQSKFHNLTMCVVPSKFLPSKVVGWTLFLEALSSSLGSTGSKDESEKNIAIMIIIEIIITLINHTIIFEHWGLRTNQKMDLSRDHRQCLSSIPSLLLSYPSSVSRFLFLTFLAGILPKDTSFELVSSL